MAKNLVEVNNVKKYFPIHKGLLNRVVGNVKAVDDVSLTIREGETFGLVGESGCGKSTLGRVILRLQSATEGSVKINGRDVHALSNRELNKMREEMQIIFQDPFGSLNPRFLVKDVIGEPLKIHTKMSAKEIDARVVELMEMVGLDQRAATVIRMNFPAVSASGSGLPGPLRSSRNSSSRTKRYPRSTCRCNRR